MTSNVGARLITEKQASLGFSAGAGSGEKADMEKIRETVLDELKDLPAGIFNRVDDIIVFNKLGEEDIWEIARRMLHQLPGV